MQFQGIPETMQELSIRFIKWLDTREWAENLLPKLNLFFSQTYAKNMFAAWPSHRESIDLRREQIARKVEHYHENQPIHKNPLKTNQIRWQTLLKFSI